VPVHQASRISGILFWRAFSNFSVFRYQWNGMSTPCLDEAVREGHVLRSTLLDHFVPIEQWADKTARKISDKLKPTAPFSQKLSVIAADTKSGQSRFRHPQHVVPLLDHAREASARRSHLVHSKITTAHTSDGRILWLFQNIAREGLDANAFQMILDKMAFDREIKALDDLAKKLEKQQLKAPAPDAPALTSGAASAR
jgi:hypothetical protein